MAQGISRSLFTPSARQKQLMNKFVKAHGSIAEAQSLTEKRKDEAYIAVHAALDAEVPRAILIDLIGSEGSVSRLIRSNRVKTN